MAHLHYGSSDDDERSVSLRHPSTLRHPIHPDEEARWRPYVGCRGQDGMDDGRRDRGIDARYEKRRHEEERERKRPRHVEVVVEEVEPVWDEQQVDEDRWMEERRRRRLEIIEKYKKLEKVESDASVDQQRETKGDASTTVKEATPEQVMTTTRALASDTQPSEKNALLKMKDAEECTAIGVSDDMFAVDYQEHVSHALPWLEKTSTDEFDMFAVGDAMDMFGVEASVTEKPVILQQDTQEKVELNIVPGLADEWDDEEGYYRETIGEVLGDRYQVYRTLGKGVFSTVLLARDLEKEGQHVAIKMIRNNDTMYRAGLKEISLLRRLQEADPDGKKHVIRFLGHFEYRKHLCMVFESMSMNLREVLKKYGKDVGISLLAVRSYAQQLFVALHHLRKCNVLHADIKPDNILVNDAKNVVRICDLGSASDVSENEITPYLVSRFYRAPEIILGMLYDPALDVWSVGCTLYELYTGKILFPGRSNNQMLKLVMELKGRFPSKMLKKGSFSETHFDSEGHFLYTDTDHLSRKEIVKKIVVTKPTRDLRMRLLETALRAKENETLLGQFTDLLDKCLALSPEKRITPKEALLHPFLRHQ